MAESPEWVIQGVLARSSRPGYPDEAAPCETVETWLNKVRAMGVNSVVCLLSADQLAYYDALPGGLLDCYRRYGLTVEDIPITDPAHDGRGKRELEQSLGRIHESFGRLTKPVLVHCSAGIDRTGAAVRYIQQRLKSGSRGDAA